MNGSLRSPVSASMIRASRERAERDGDECLRFATREQRRAVGRGSTPVLIVMRTHGFDVAAVDTRGASDDALAHDAVFEVGDLLADVAGARLRHAIDQRRSRGTTAALISHDRGVALQLVDDPIGLGQLLRALAASRKRPTRH